MVLYWYHVSDILKSSVFQFQQSWKRRKQNSSNMSESYAIVVSKFIPQNTDSPLKIQRKSNSPVIEMKRGSKKKTANFTPVGYEVHVGQRNGQNCEVTQV